MYKVGHNIRYDHPLKREIYRQGYTISQFANRVGISRFTLNELFTGRTKSLNGLTIGWVADALGMPFDAIWEMCHEQG